MKNWAIQGLLYDFNPSLHNYIKFKWHHFHFCKKDDPTITATLYIDNLIDEIKHDIVTQKSINKKSLTLAVTKRILENEPAKKQLINLFEEKQGAINEEEIKLFLNNISSLINHSSVKEEQITNKEELEGSTDFPVRTYVIATHIFLEINNNEWHYETLIRDTTALKEFIASKFNANKISGRIADMKSFSYKKILTGKNNEGPKGQLKPQLKQIALNPAVFGKDVSAFAENILKQPFYIDNKM